MPSSLFQRNHEPSKYCISCGHVGAPKVCKQGVLAIEILLYLFAIIPGIIYSVWRGSREIERCPLCDKESLVPLDTPIAVAALQNQPAPSGGEARLSDPQSPDAPAKLRFWSGPDDAPVKKTSPEANSAYENLEHGGLKWFPNSRPKPLAETQTNYRLDTESDSNAEVSHSTSGLLLITVCTLLFLIVGIASVTSESTAETPEGTSYVQEISLDWDRFINSGYAFINHYYSSSTDREELLTRVRYLRKQGGAPVHIIRKIRRIKSELGKECSRAQASQHYHEWLAKLEHEITVSQKSPSTYDDHNIVSQAWWVRQDLDRAKQEGRIREDLYRAKQEEAAKLRHQKLLRQQTDFPGFLGESKVSLFTAYRNAQMSGVLHEFQIVAERKVDFNLISDFSSQYFEHALTPLLLELKRIGRTNDARKILFRFLGRFPAIPGTDPEYDTLLAKVRNELS